MRYTCSDLAAGGLGVGGLTFVGGLITMVASEGSLALPSIFIMMGALSIAGASGVIIMTRKHDPTPICGGEAGYALIGDTSGGRGSLFSRLCCGKRDGGNGSGVSGPAPV